MPSSNLTTATSSLASLGGSASALLNGLNLTDASSMKSMTFNRELFRHCKQLKDIIPIICNYEASYYQYRLNLAANAAFLIIFSVFLICYALVYILRRRYHFFSVVFGLGLVCEVLGYVGRVMSYDDQWREAPFLMQICMLTMGPAFLAAGLYYCMGKIVQTLRWNDSFLTARPCLFLFIPCDFISLVLQAIGGGLTSAAFQKSDLEGLTPGKNAMEIGLLFQLGTLLVFCGFSLVFFIYFLRRRRAAIQDGYDVQRIFTLRFSLFLAALGLSTLAIFARSVFRVVELWDGWSGPMMGEQVMFIACEGGLVAVGVAVLLIFHPNIFLKELVEVAEIVPQHPDEKTDGSRSSSARGQVEQIEDPKTA